MACAVNTVVNATTPITTGTAISIPATQGNLIVLVAQILSSADAITTVVDGTNAYVSAGTAASVAGSADLEVWYAKNAVTGITSITPSWSGGGNGVFVIYDIQGADPYNPVDGYSSLSNQATAQNFNGPAVTPTSNLRGVVIGGMCSSLATTTSIDVPFIVDRQVRAVGHFTSPPNSSVAPSYHSQSSAIWGALTVSFMPPTLIYPGDMTPGSCVSWR